MRLPRLYINLALQPERELELPFEITHYVNTVLRLRSGSQLILFNGQGGEYLAQLTNCTKKRCSCYISAHFDLECESSLHLTLVQAVSRPEHMDYTLQKAVELGVQRIVPLTTERSAPLDSSRVNRRHAHWQKVIQSACEQCGRNRLPLLEPLTSLSQWLSRPLLTTQNFLLSPQGNISLTAALTVVEPITLLVGSEGGLTESEMQQAIGTGYAMVTLGPRILRTETAATVALTICQAWGGDLA